MSGDCISGFSRCQLTWFEICICPLCRQNHSYGRQINPLVAESPNYRALTPISAVTLWQITHPNVGRITRTAGKSPYGGRITQWQRTHPHGR